MRFPSAKVPRAYGYARVTGRFARPRSARTASPSPNVRSSVLGGRRRRAVSPPLSPCGALSVVTPLPPSLGPSVRGRARSGENGRTDALPPSRLVLDEQQFAPLALRTRKVSQRFSQVQSYAPLKNPQVKRDSFIHFMAKIMSSSAAAVSGLRRAACLLLM